MFATDFTEQFAPFDRADPAAGTIPVNFEWYPAEQAAVGTIVAMEGGPGYPSTGSRDYYLELFAGLQANAGVEHDWSHSVQSSERVVGPSSIRGGMCSHDAGDVGDGCVPEFEEVVKRQLDALRAVDGHCGHLAVGLDPVDDYQTASESKGFELGGMHARKGRKHCERGVHRLHGLEIAGRCPSVILRHAQHQLVPAAPRCCAGPGRPTTSR
jgi:hypothetical protein